MLRVALAAAAAVTGLWASAADANFCPRALHRATRLVIITVPNMTSVKATMHNFTRTNPADATWERSGEPEAAVVGAAGIGWSADYDHLAKKDEPIKREGDRRTPAGIFRIAEPFGFETRPLDDYVKLAPGKSFCVDDPTSVLYGRIVDKRLAQTVKSSEDMATVPAYRRGIIVDYPARRGAKAGSCIFVHVWENDSTGTTARIALPEERVAALQEWSSKGFTAIAVVTEEGANRFKGCLPLGNASSRNNAPALPMRKPQAEGRRASLSR